MSRLHYYEPIIVIPSVHDDGPLALYRSEVYGAGVVHLDLGTQIVTTSAQVADLTALAKAILNETEPEALVANQKVAEPSGEQTYDIPALDAEFADLKARVTALESPEPTLWGYKVGDRVKYTMFGVLTGEERVVAAIKTGAAGPWLSLARPATGGVVGAAYNSREIERA